jgi:uncharacterized protein involved in exopolysaccharide biosynthesis
MQIGERNRQADQDRVFPLGAIARWVFASKYLIAALTVVGGIGGVVTSKLVEPQYEAVASVLPSADAGSQMIMDQIAALTGAGGTAGSDFQEIFKDLVESRRLLDPLIERSWPHEGEGTTLYEVFGVEHDTLDAAGKRRAYLALLRRLRSEALRVHRNRFTGFVEIAGRMPRDPELAASFTNATVQRLADLTREITIQRAVDRRRRVERRSLEVEEQMLLAEAELAAFEAANRNYGESPGLSAQHRELQRRVQVHTTVWGELRRQLELARLEESRQQAPIEVLDWAVAPVRPVYPRTRFFAVTGALLGVALAVAGRLGLQLLRVARSEPAES